MYLKAVELCGFKSFADKTHLTFDKQLTAVVGPNGCGKSNVVDAIRWCLGEQSASSLRTPQMMGIVFNGSQTRAPLNLAEVSLTFDNSSNILPIDYTEVTITRRLFRSGESEYYINKVQCRLKDIRDMFLDTGVGREGYSIFEQGKVELITNAKPEERRAIFEEAAGVSKYKVRREETLRKLDRVHQDMNRVNDIIGVIKEQINSLESAVRKAKLYQKNQEELRTLETADTTQKIAALESELAPATSQLEELNNNALEKNTLKDQLEADVSNIQVEKTTIEKDLADNHSLLSQIDTEIAQLEERVKISQVRVKEFKERQETLTNNISNFDSTRKSLENQINTINSELQKAEETFNEHTRYYEEKKSNYENIKSEITKNTQQISKLNSYVFELVDKKTQINNDIATISNNAIATKTNISVQNQELKKVSDEKLSIEKELGNLRAQQNQSNETLSAAKQEHESLNSKISGLKEEIEILELEKDAIKQKYYELNSKMVAVRELQQKNPQLSTVHYILSSNFQGIHGTLNSILSIHDLHEELVSNLLGDKLNYLLCDTLTDAKTVIEHLEQNKKGRATFIILESLPETHSAWKNFLGELRTEKPISSAVTYDPKWEKLVRFVFNNTYFSGNTVYQETVMHGGAYETKQVSPEIECKEIEEQIANLKTQENANNETLQSKEKEISELVQLQKQKYDELQQLAFNQAVFEKELSNKSGQFDLSKIEEETIQSEIKHLSEEELKLEENSPLLKNELAQIEKNTITAQTEMTQLELSVNELKDKEAGAGSEFTESAKSLSTFEERLKSYKREYETLNSNLKLQQDQYLQSTNEIQSLSERIIEQETVFAAESKNIDKLYESRAEFDKKVSELKLQQNNVYKILEQKQNQLNHLRNEITKLSEKIHDLQIIQKTKEIEKNNFETKLREAGLEYADVKDSYINIAVDPDEIIRLRRRIESIGPVNLTAQEQYTDLEKRYNFLFEQQQDLIKAEEDLRQAITKLNSSIQASFHETFDKVRENFKKLFSQLFEGGESDLILTDENNLLESGIDIVAQPQGKKLQSISLLSGGEKALTAIALLFAFFMVRPSPICILDEVDAPLDESNVTRFINIIKVFSANSQFLMITHNKRTMEAADILYGVTMEEFGISKIISIRLHKQEIPGLIAEREPEETAN
ncbi:MAG: AAA family ATPase [Elusimicrobia bacterium]|nr:AAA family ATPase [Elusimicrobiota bacterium]